MDSANHTTSRAYHCFFCRLSIIYNPTISFINFDQQQVRLLDSCSGFEKEIFISLTADHLVVGDLDILRQLLFSIIHPVDWPQLLSMEIQILFRTGTVSVQTLNTQDEF